MELNYQKYTASGEAEQTTLLLELEHSITSINAKEAKLFLGSILNDPAQSEYRRKKSLDLSAQLVFLNKLRFEGVVDKILDLEVTDNHFVLLSAIKIASLFCLQSKDAIAPWLQQMALHHNAEIRSQAYYSIGKYYLFEALNSEDHLLFSQNIIQAHDRFQKAEDEIENRIDATLFKNISSFLISAKAGQTHELTHIYEDIKPKLWEFARYTIENKEVAYYINLVNSFSIIKILSELKTDSWLDFRSEFNEVLILLQKIDVSLTCENIGFVHNMSMLSGVKYHILDDILITKFQQEQHKLKRLVDEYDDDPKVKEEIKQILELITSIEKNKKKDEADIVTLTALFHRCFPNIPLDTVQNDLIGLGNISLQSTLPLLTEYIGSNHSLSTSISTGFSQGDEILASINGQLANLLPTYPLAKRIEFLLVLRDVVNYFIQAVRGEKSRFQFLFKPDALEADLQVNMLTHLHTTERAERYTPETKEYADGGRVDINYRSEVLQIPIELKRTHQKITWDTVLENYIAQAQTYAYSRDQLAIFVVLDLSDNQKSAPEANIRNLFSILTLPPRQGIEIKYADYVIAFILPGNKILPSERSSYK